MPVTLEKDGGIATIHLNNPPANSYDFDLYRELGAAIDQVRVDLDVKVCILVSDVGRFFSAGANITYLKTTDPRLKTQFCLFCNETLDKIARSPQVFIACCEGTAVGGGLEIALGCDLRFGAAEARFGLPEVTLGLLPGTGGTQRLARLIGAPKALDLCITGRLVGGEEALSLGILDRCWPQAAVREKTYEYARQLLAGATYAISNIKLAIMNGIEMPLISAIRYEGELQNLLFRSQDGMEGLSAFLEKRKANWSGR